MRCKRSDDIPTSSGFPVGSEAAVNETASVNNSERTASFMEKYPHVMILDEYGGFQYHLGMRNTFIIGGLMLAAALWMPAQAPVRTASQQYKNIQVFKDAPATEFIAGMRFLSTSLGVECEFCHEGTRQTDTPNKVKARQMMLMMADINAKNFGGQQVVTCNTCHNGHHIPTNAPTPTGQYTSEGPQIFYKPAGPPVGATDGPMSDAYKVFMAKQQADRASSTPTAAQVLAKYVTALGGQQAVRAVTSRVITSTLGLSPNVRGAGPMVFVQQTQYFKAPNLYAATSQPFNGQATAKGFDGTDAWTQAANGTVTVAAGVDLARAKRDADFYANLALERQYKSLELLGSEKINARDTWALRGALDGDNPETLYFDAQSGLLLRKSIYNNTSLGKYLINTDYEDYRDVGGVKIPFLIRTLSISPADTAITHVEKVENNAAIDAAKLVKPAPRPAAGR